MCHALCEWQLAALRRSTSSEASKPTGVVAYLLAPDMDATLAAIERAGGSVVIPTTNVMGMGDFAQFRDPDGNVIGLWRDSGAG